MYRMRSKASVFIVCAAATAIMAGCEPGPLPDTGTRTSEVFHSDLLGEDLKLSYRLPPDYESRPGDTFQAVYQLDPTFVGLREMDFTTGYISAMEEAGEIDSTIVIGIDYAGANQRFRDFEMPGDLTREFDGDKIDVFYKVMRDEVVPRVETAVRASPVDRALVGHSLGGRFALYSAFRYDPADPLFTRIVANDSSYCEGLFAMERWMSETADDADMRVFMAMALWNGPQHKLSHDWLFERLAGRGYTSLALDERQYDTDHGGVIGPGFEDGLRFILGGDL